MQASILIASLVLGSGILAAENGVVPALAQTPLAPQHASAVGAATARATPRLTLHEVQLGLDAMGYREVTKLSRNGDVLRIQATDPHGRRVDMDVDSVTGRIPTPRSGEAGPSASQSSRPPG